MYNAKGLVSITHDIRLFDCNIHIRFPHSLPSGPLSKPSIPRPNSSSSLSPSSGMVPKSSLGGRQDLGLLLATRVPEPTLTYLLPLKEGGDRCGGRLMISSCSPSVSESDVNSGVLAADSSAEALLGLISMISGLNASTLLA